MSPQALPRYPKPCQALYLRPVPPRPPQPRHGGNRSSAWSRGGTETPSSSTMGHLRPAWCQHALCQCGESWQHICRPLLPNTHRKPGASQKPNAGAIRLCCAPASQPWFPGPRPPLHHHPRSVAPPTPHSLPTGQTHAGCGCQAQRCLPASSRPLPGLSLAAPPPASPPSPLPPPRPLPALGLCCRHHRDLLGLRWSAPRRRRPRL